MAAICPDFKWLEFLFSKSGLFATQPLPDCSKSRLVWILDPHCIYVTDESCNFGIEDCLALNCTLKCCRISHEMKRTLRVKKLFVF